MDRIISGKCYTVNRVNEFARHIALYYNSTCRIIFSMYHNNVHVGNVECIGREDDIEQVCRCLTRFLASHLRHVIVHTNGSLICKSMFPPVGTYMQKIATFLLSTLRSNYETMQNLRNTSMDPQTINVHSFSLGVDKRIEIREQILCQWVKATSQIVCDPIISTDTASDYHFYRVQTGAVAIQEYRRKITASWPSVLPFMLDPEGRVFQCIMYNIADTKTPLVQRRSRCLHSEMPSLRRLRIEDYRLRHASRESAQIFPPMANIVGELVDTPHGPGAEFSQFIGAPSLASVPLILYEISRWWPLSACAVCKQSEMVHDVLLEHIDVFFTLHLGATLTPIHFLWEVNNGRLYQIGPVTMTKAIIDEYQPHYEKIVLHAAETEEEAFRFKQRCLLPEYLFGDEPVEQPSIISRPVRHIFHQFSLDVALRILPDHEEVVDNEKNVNTDTNVVIEQEHKEIQTHTMAQMFNVLSQITESPMIPEHVSQAVLGETNASDTLKERRRLRRRSLRKRSSENLGE